MQLVEAAEPGTLPSAPPAEYLVWEALRDRTIWGRERNDYFEIGTIADSSHSHAGFWRGIPWLAGFPLGTDGACVSSDARHRRGTSGIEFAAGLSDSQGDRQPTVGLGGLWGHPCSSTIFGRPKPKISPTAFMTAWIGMQALCLPVRHPSLMQAGFLKDDRPAREVPAASADLAPPLWIGNRHSETAALGASPRFPQWASANHVEITAGFLPGSVLRGYALLCKMQRAPRQTAEQRDAARRANCRRQ